MSVPSSSSLRNKLISKQLDVGKQAKDVTSESAAHPTEAVESPLNAFAQSPTSADRLRERHTPLDELLTGPEGEDVEAQLIASGNSSASIDGNYGPKTLEALNLFQQEQVDALKLQTHSVLNGATARVGADNPLARDIKLATSGAVDASKQDLTSLSDANAKSVNSIEHAEVKK